MGQLTTFLKGLLDFKGRASRTEYWLFSLFSTLILGAMISLDLTMGTRSSEYTFPAFTFVGSLILAIPALAVTVRRLHDTGKRGTYFFFSLIPLVGSIILLIAMVKRGDPNNNEFGLAKNPSASGNTSSTSTKSLNIGAQVRDYAMYFALAIIVIFFAMATPGATFITSKNIADLLNQTGYIAVLAVGMTLVIVVRQIDLSVGFLAGFVGAMAAISLQTWGWPVYLTIPFALIIGTISGLLTGLLVSKLGIPAFVATLAGWLIYRGALLLVTSSTGTLIIDDPFFIALGNGYIPDFPFTDAFLPHVHKVTFLVGLIATLVMIFSDARKRASRQKYGFEVSSTSLWILKWVFIGTLLMVITSIMSGVININPLIVGPDGVPLPPPPPPRSAGLSWTFVIMMVVTLAYSYFSENTVLGRHIYAVGGNPEAAELSGISVKKTIMFVFGSMGFLTAISGILFASRLRSATPQAGTLFELDAIAAAYIGGVSAAGGVGKISSSLIGALVYMSLMNGMNLLGTDQAWQYIIRGIVLAVAVIFDVATRKAKR